MKETLEEAAGQGAHRGSLESEQEQAPWERWLQVGTEPCVLDIRYFCCCCFRVRGNWLGLVLKLEFVRGLGGGRE